MMYNVIKGFLGKIKSVLYYGSVYWYYKSIFGSLGKRSRLQSRGLRLESPSNIFIGSRVFIGEGSWLAAAPHVEVNPKLIIEDGVSIGRMNQIYSTTSITIEKNVLIADRVYISDSAHDSADINIPIRAQKITSKGQIVIGEGSWIGINVCILGASIGKNCVIGANSVVTKNIPDFCIVGGIPAIIIKRFNPKFGRWERTMHNGEFIVSTNNLDGDD